MKSALKVNPKIVKRVPHFKTVLVAGSSSYLGQNLCEKLLAQGFRVVGLDTVAPKAPHPRFIFVKSTLLEGFPKEIKEVDAIFNLAPATGGAGGGKDFWALMQSTKAVLDFAHRCGAPLLQASSLEVYKIGSQPFEGAGGSCAESQKAAESLVWEYIRAEKVDARLARLPQIYGPGFLEEAPTHHLAEFIQAVETRLIASLQRESLVVYGTGLDKEFYGFVDDITDGLIQALFAPHTQGKIYPLCDLEGITTLELAYLVKSLSSKDISVEFKPGPEKEYPDYQIIDGQSLKDLGWEPRVSLREGIRKTISTSSSTSISDSKSISSSNSMPNSTPSAVSDVAALINVKAEKKGKDSLKEAKRMLKKQKPLRRPEGIVKKARPWGKKKAALLGMILIFALPGWFFGNLFLGGRHLYGAVGSAQALDFANSSRQAAQAARNFAAVSSLAVLGGEKAADYRHLLQSAAYASQTLAFETRGLAVLKKALEALSPQSAAAPPSQQEFIEAAANFSKGLERYLLLEGELKNTNQALIPEKYHNYLEEETRLATQENLETLAAVSSALPDALGLVGPKNYLILLQNNQELRATGGFIGAYAILRLEDSKIKDLKVDDVYNIDGLLEEQGLGEEPPPEFAKYLGVAKIYLRDSNYDPDFAKSAALASKLFSEATGEAVDGVVAVNQSVLKNILQKVGSLDLAEFGNISHNNFFEKSVFYAEKNYFEGSQAKRGFLKSVSEALMQKMLDDPPGFLQAAAPVFLNALQSKDILLALPEGGLGNAAAKRGWDGRFKALAGSDWLGLWEENLGANKANYTVYRNVSYEVKEINRERELEASLTVAYINEAGNNVWPLGDYKFFATTTAFPDAVIAEPSFYKELKPGERWVKKITWLLPAEINGNNYSLKVVKQPGIINTTFKFLYTPILGGTGFSWEGELTKDLEFEIK